MWTELATRRIVQLWLARVHARRPNALLRFKWRDAGLSADPLPLPSTFSSVSVRSSGSVAAWDPHRFHGGRSGTGNAVAGRVRISQGPLPLSTEAQSSL